MRLGDLALSISEKISGFAKGVDGAVYGTFGKLARFELTERVKEQATKERIIPFCKGRNCCRCDYR